MHVTCTRQIIISRRIPGDVVDNFQRHYSLPTATSYNVLVSSLFSSSLVEYELSRKISCQYGTNSQILGRTVRNEHLALMIYTTVFGGAWLATRGGGAKTVKPTTVQQAKESVLLKADST
jgi:hypothetical protein